METEPTPVGEHLAEIYANLPDAALETEEARIRDVLSELSGKLIAITEVKEAKDEHSLSA